MYNKSKYTHGDMPMLQAKFIEIPYKVLYILNYYVYQKLKKKKYFTEPRCCNDNNITKSNRWSFKFTN